jgi:hypothetical protein
LRRALAAEEAGARIERAMVHDQQGGQSLSSGACLWGAEGTTDPKEEAGRPARAVTIKSKGKGGGGTS